ncbi:DUF3365 domain-containing protein [Gammaproteobacteria bacterium AH-315-K14]|nr:DUF3365 domain-containing protein [Gammaproteobacteria bacterium AH-315-K14]
MILLKHTILTLCVLLSLPIVSLADTISDDEQTLRAIAIAATVEDLIRTVRLQYTRIVVNKLEKEGTGSALHFNKRGYVPLPAQFIRSIGNVKRGKSNSNSLPEHQFSLRSHWNINTSQGLQDAFERNGWKFLIAQQDRHMETEKSLRYLTWKPYIKVENTPSGKILRYMNADIASSISCVKCHNKYEKTKTIMSYRRINGTTRTKEFKLYDLVGSIAI